MIPSFHAVFGLRHRDKTAKVIDYKGQVIRAQGITSFTHGYCRFAWLRHNNYIGLAISVPVLPISDAKHCNRSRKRLQPFPQTFATAIANVCNRHRKRLHPPSQTFATLLVALACDVTGLRRMGMISAVFLSGRVQRWQRTLLHLVRINVSRP